MLPSSSVSPFGGSAFGCPTSAIASVPTETSPSGSVSYSTSLALGSIVDLASLGTTTISCDLFFIFSFLYISYNSYLYDIFYRLAVRTVIVIHECYDLAEPVFCIIKKFERVARALCLCRRRFYYEKSKKKH